MGVMTHLETTSGGVARRTRASAVLLWTIAIPGTYALTAFMYFVIPLLPRWGSALLGTALFAPDAVLNAGILEWGYRSLWSSSLAVFDWPAGFPVRNTLANVEHLLGWQIGYSALRSLGVTIAGAYNTLLLVSFVISGLGAALLARRFGASTGGAWVAGLVFAFAPFHVNHAVHLQTMSIAWSPFAILFLDRFLDQRRFIDAAGIAIAYVLSVLSGMYFAVLLPLILTTYTVLAFALRRHRFDWRAIGGLIMAMLVSVAVLSPVLLPYVRFTREFPLQHNRGTLSSLSIALGDLVRIPDWVVVWSGTPLAEASNFAAAFPGLMVLLLVTCGLLLRAEQHAVPDRRGMLALMCLAAVLLAFGPVLQIDQGRNVRLAGISVPMPGIIFMAISAIRFPMRILLYAYLFGSVLAGLGATALELRVPARVRAVLISVLVLAIAVEFWPYPRVAAGSVTLPPPLELSEAYPFLADESDRGAVVELPGADNTGYRTPVMSRYSLGSAGHLRRIVGYNGSVPLPAADRLQYAAGRLPDERARGILTTAGVTRLVVHRDLMAPGQAEQLIGRLNAAGYRAVFQGTDATVFALER